MQDHQGNVGRVVRRVRPGGLWVEAPRAKRGPIWPPRVGPREARAGRSRVDVLDTPRSDHPDQPLDHSHVAK
eukprot:1636273-Lingulodinium_polyedra.AAC.1